MSTLTTTLKSILAQPTNFNDESVKSGSYLDNFIKAFDSSALVITLDENTDKLVFTVQNQTFLIDQNILTCLALVGFKSLENLTEALPRLSNGFIYPSQEKAAEAKKSTNSAASKPVSKLKKQPTAIEYLEETLKETIKTLIPADLADIVFNPSVISSYPSLTSKLLPEASRITYQELTSLEELQLLTIEILKEKFISVTTFANNTFCCITDFPTYPTIVKSGFLAANGFEIVSTETDMENFQIKIFLKQI